MVVARNQEHYVIMTVIYDALSDIAHGEGKGFHDVKNLVSELSGVPYEQVSHYVKSTINESLIHYGDIVSAFQPKLINWTWDRLPLLTRSVLVMSYAHFFYIEEVDKRIVIDIAVNLAKKYIDEKQAKFINGILDKVLVK